MGTCCRQGSTGCHRNVPRLGNPQRRQLSTSRSMAMEWAQVKGSALALAVALGSGLGWELGLGSALVGLGWELGMGLEVVRVHHSTTPGMP